jgi:hypothetical protein
VWQKEWPKRYCRPALSIPLSVKAGKLKIAAEQGLTGPGKKEAPIRDDLPAISRLSESWGHQLQARFHANFADMTLAILPAMP